MINTIRLPAFGATITVLVCLASTFAMTDSNRAVAQGISIQLGRSPYAYYNGYGSGYSGYRSGYGVGYSQYGYGSGYTGYGSGMYGYGSRSSYSYPTTNYYGYRTIVPTYSYPSGVGYYGGRFGLSYNSNRNRIYNPYYPYGIRR